MASQAAELARLKAERDRPHGPAGPFVDVSKEELLARAARCELRYEVPRVLDARPWTVSDATVRDLGLSDTERDALNEAFADVHASMAVELRRLFIEAGGDAKIADELTGQSLMGEIIERLPKADMAVARARLAQERAGLVPPPADPTKLPLTDRILRLLAGSGDDIEHRLGERIGADRAHTLRARRDGFEGRSRTSSSGCNQGAPTGQGPR